jgi:hypothetical protein
MPKVWVQERWPNGLPSPLNVNAYAGPPYNGLYWTTNADGYFDTWDGIFCQNLPVDYLFPNNPFMEKVHTYFAGTRSELLTHTGVAVGSYLARWFTDAIEHIRQGG